MMGRLRWVAFLLAATLVSAGCTRAQATNPVPNAQQTVDALRALQPTATSFVVGDADIPRDRIPFDINQYFTVLKHLNMEPGYALDYVYLLSGNGGRPVIYARGADSEPFSTYSDFLAAKGTGQRDDPMASGDKVPGERIWTDGTAEGFFEWVVLQIIGGQFYLFWHAGYDDVKVICDTAAFESLVSELARSEPLSPEAEREARRIDFTPTVRFEDTQVTVRVVTFTKWGGFAEQTYTLSREPPVTIIAKGGRGLVGYDSGMRFQPPAGLPGLGYRLRLTTGAQSVSLGQHDGGMVD